MAWRRAAWWVVVGALLLAWRGEARESPLRHRWLYASYSYASLGHPEPWAAAYRAGQMLAAMLLSGAFLALVPRRTTFFTAVGARTLGVFLIHGFLIRALEKFGVFTAAPWPLLWVALGIALTFVLSLEVVQRPFRVLLEPRWLARVLLR